MEFKTLGSEDFSQKEDRKNLAIALSGFANSDGGVIVWGVYAKKNLEGVDCAAELRPFSNPALVHSRLLELAPNSPSPVIDGVTHAIVPCVNSGFVVTGVPASDRAPCMAADGRYYKRSGSSFYRMEHFDVADMFGRRRRPILVPVGRHHCSSSSRHPVIVIGIKNEGRAVARVPYLGIRPPNGYARWDFGVDGNGSELLVRNTQGNRAGWILYGGADGRVIHPGTTLEIASIHSLEQLTEKGPSVVVEVEVCAEDFPLISSALMVPIETR